MLFLITLVSCGKDGPLGSGGEKKIIYKITPAEKEKYTYEFYNENCSTGAQMFETFFEACDGLVDHELNKECALEDREELFSNAHCPGDFS